MEDKEAFPADVTAVPRCSVIGLPSSGKTDLCKKIQEVTGAVHLQLEEVIEDLVDRDSAFGKKLRDRLKIQGKELDDMFIVQVI